MRRTLMALLLIVSGHCGAQQPEIQLLLHGHKDTVKLIWLAESWPKGLTGFNVKRRVTGGEWQTLNPAPITPSIDESEFANRTNDPGALQRMPAKRAEMLAKRNISEKPLDKRLQELTDDPFYVKFTSFVVAQDYIGALVQGFAYLDARVPPAAEYEYGLFLVRGTVEPATPVATQRWKPGPATPLIVSFGEPEVSWFSDRGGLTVRWTVDKDEVRAKHLREFVTMMRDPQGVDSEVGRSQINFADAMPRVGIFEPDHPRTRAGTFWVVPVDIFDEVGRPSAEVVLDGKTTGFAAAASRAPSPPPTTVPAPNQPTAPPPVATGPVPDTEPASGMGTWLRADDISPRITILTSWRSPAPLKFSATASGRGGETAWRMPDQIAGLPATRLVERSSLQFSAPAQFQDFTLFVVGRQVPGSRAGTLLSSSEGEAQSIGWAEGNSVTVRGGPDNVHSLPFAGAQEYHVLTVRSVGAHAMVYANGQALSESPLRLGEPFAVQFLGTPARAEAVGGINVLRGLSAKARENPTEGADVAELLIWPRALGDEEMRATLAYLNRRFSLGLPVAAPGVLTAGGKVPASDPSADGAATSADAAYAPGPVKPGSPRDPLANHPTTVGQQFAETSRCTTKIVPPSDPTYCLWPAPNARTWHRADDEFAHANEPRLANWRNPMVTKLMAEDQLRADAEMHRPQVVNAQLRRYPIVRFDDDRRMDFSRPLDLPRFTIFIVGRRAPGAAGGPIFSAGAGGPVYLFWHHRAGLMLGASGMKVPLTFPYPAQDQFHMLMLRGDGGSIRVAVNGEGVGSQPMPPEFGPFRVGRVGGGLVLTQTTAAALEEILRDGFTLGGGRSKLSSEFAEILVYDRVLDADEMAATERYLRKKYTLP